MLNKYFIIIFILLSVSVLILSIGPCELPCKPIFCSNHDIRTNHYCTCCEECREKYSYSFCIRGRHGCSCMQTPPRDCSSKKECEILEQYSFCYVPDRSYRLDPPRLNDRSEKSIKVDIERFWQKDKSKEINFKNLTLYLQYGVQSPYDCSDRDSGSRSQFFRGNTCIREYKVLMPSIDYTTDDQYYYDDGRNPTIQFDRQIFNSTKSISLWYEVTFRKMIKISNESIPFEYRVKSEILPYAVNTNGVPVSRALLNRPNPRNFPLKPPMIVDYLN